MKKQPVRKIITNKPNRQNVRKINAKHKRQLVKPYGLNGGTVI